MAVAVKVGPWGAPGGQDRDISSEPQGLESIKLCSSNNPKGCIHGISFFYVDGKVKKPILGGPWGVVDEKKNPITNIPIKSGEHIVELSGTTDGSVLTSLKLVTNQGEYEVGCPGESDSTFSVPLQQEQGNGNVVAFFGRSDNTLKALGIYVPVMQGSPVKVGPWGDNGGIEVDITTPVQLKSLTVYSTDSSDGHICGFSFTYIDKNGGPNDAGPWGTIKGKKNPPFYLKQGEYVNNISGTTADGNGVTSLKFTTNQKRDYGPFGCERGTAFSVPLPDGMHNGAVVGFFGRSGDSLVALGVYVGLAPKP